ncbi:outer membrane protein [Herbaspirillum chlorophenolicum]|uniref:outer membrane protein n=1 Tax=Herbaspirillum chlorophenolicum TaxID=211589 RepID=UPI001470C1B5|nr:porin family protein [Herbaspirillum chlorophenolicum]
MKKHVLMTAGAMLAMAAVSASAQAVKSNQGVYVGLEGGYANATSLSSVRGERTTSETRNAGFVRAALGYQFTPNWALELGYFGTGDFKRNGTDGVNRYHDKYKASGADFAGVYKFTEGVPGLYLKAGLSYAEVSGDRVRTTAGVKTGSGSASTSGTGYLLGLGYEYDITKNWSASANYTRYQRVGSATDVNANVLSAGLKYRF